MSFLSNGEIIAIITLIATCPPSVVLLCHLIRRGGLSNQTVQTGTYISAVASYHGSDCITQDVELASRSAQPVISSLVESQVDLLVPRPGLAHVPARQ